MLRIVAHCGVAPGNVVLCSAAVRSAVLCSVAPCDSMPVGAAVPSVPLVVLPSPEAAAAALLPSPLASARVRRGATAAAFALFGCQGGSPRHRRPPWCRH
jgi:hypothetical protein